MVEAPLKINLILVGGPNSGKTSICKMWEEKKFDAEQKSTLGLDYVCMYQ